MHGYWLIDRYIKPRKLRLCWRCENNSPPTLIVALFPQYYFQNNSIILTFSKNDKDIEYELEVSSELFKLLEKHDHFIMLESSKDYGDINYIVHKLK